MLIQWGAKYGAAEVTQFVETIAAKASRPFRTVLITDRPRDELSDGIVQRDFPVFFLRDEMKTSGCQAKLAMFEDERFMSWAAEKTIQAFPKTMSDKFLMEFMLPWRWLISLRAALPWSKARWQKLEAVSLPGVEVKEQELLQMPKGGGLVRRKARRLIRSEKAVA